MIIRSDDGCLLCLTQPDHAALAADIMARWTELDGHPRRESILLATREHDGGWIEEDRATHVGTGGDPLDFISVPVPVKHRIWPRAVTRIASTDPYAAALVAQHALSVYRPHRTDALWQSFFSTMEEAKADLRRRCGHVAGHVEDDYRFVQTGDQLSLIFCNGWTAPFPRPGGQAWLSGSTLHISPDPFAGERVPLSVSARRIDARPYASARDLRDTLDAAPTETVEGVAIGDALPNCARIE
jgi:hypothetical protein